MKIGSQAVKASAISASNADTIVVRGRDLCRDLVGSISFTEHAWLLVAGEPAERSAAPHPRRRAGRDRRARPRAERAAGRMTLAAAPEALQGAVAAGILGCGSVILGSPQKSAARFMLRQSSPAAAGSDLARRGAVGAVDGAAARAAHSRATATRCTSALDPRVGRLLAIAAETACAAPNTSRRRAYRARTAGRQRQAAGHERVRRDRRRCCSTPAFRCSRSRACRSLARTASLIAHLLEEQRAAHRFRAVGRRRRRASQYDGPCPAGFEPEPRLSAAPCASAARRPHRRTGHVHHRALRRHDARRPRRRRHQGREPGRRSRIAPTSAACTRRTSRPTTATSAASRCDLKQRRRPRALRRRCRDADVYMQNFRPGTAERLGAGAGACAPQSALVYCSISGFGADGPYAERPSYDSVAQALSGFLSRRRRRGAPALPRARAGRRDHRHLRRIRHPGRAARARVAPAGPPGRGLDVRGDGAFRGRTLRRLFRARPVAEVESIARGSRRRISCARRTIAFSRFTSPRSRSSGPA